MPLKGKRVLVMGLGRFGGGVGVAKYLAQQGADVLVTDLLPAATLSPSVDQLAGLPIQYRLGGHLMQDFTSADLVVVNPAVDPRANPFLEAARAASVPFTSEIRLLTAALPDRSRVIGVTGTAGKSTTTAMIGHLLSKQLKHSRAYVGGNIGGSLLDQLTAIQPTDWVVLELSSFMLEGLDADRWSPGVAVVTNIAPNHLDRHGDTHAYTHAKQAILRHQRPNDLALLGQTAADWATNPGVTRTLVPPPSHAIPLAIPGRHNQFNAGCARAVVKAIGVDDGTSPISLADFPGLPHRLQAVGEHRGVRYFNDSKATTPEAAMLAIASFTMDSPTSPRGRLHAILGGYDKRSDLTPLARTASKHCRAVYTIGATGDAIAAAAQQAGGTVHRCETLDRAVEQAQRNAQPGDTVLLSPGCAAWDQFDHFEHRGAAFTQAVSNLHTNPPQPTTQQPQKTL